MAKKKEKLLTEDIKYVPEVNESVIMDRPSQPVVIVSNRESFENFKKSRQDFLIYINEQEIFNTKLTSKDNVMFEEDCLYIFGKKYSYRGIRIKNIN